LYDKSEIMLRTWLSLDAMPQFPARSYKARAHTTQPHLMRRQRMIEL